MIFRNGTLSRILIGIITILVMLFIFFLGRYSVSGDVNECKTRVERAELQIYNIKEDVGEGFDRLDERLKEQNRKLDKLNDMIVEIIKETRR